MAAIILMRQWLGNRETDEAIASFHRTVERIEQGNVATVDLIMHPRLRPRNDRRARFDYRKAERGAYNQSSDR
jgi:hypothetical protein